MHNAFIMQMLDSQHHFAHYSRCASFCQIRSCFPVLQYAYSFYMLHDDVDVVMIDEALAEFDDVGVVELLHDGQFFFKEAHIFIIDSLSVH